MIVFSIITKFDFLIWSKFDSNNHINFLSWKTAASYPLSTRWLDWTSWRHNRKRSVYYVATRLPTWQDIGLQRSKLFWKREQYQAGRFNVTAEVQPKHGKGTERGFKPDLTNDFGSRWAELGGFQKLLIFWFSHTTAGQIKQQKNRRKKKPSERQLREWKENAVLMYVGKAITGQMFYSYNMWNAIWKKKIMWKQTGRGSRRSERIPPLCSGMNGKLRSEFTHGSTKLDKKR